MATFTSTQAGNWSSAATWGGGGVPGNGDRAVVNHVVDVTDDRIVGTSPAGTDTTTYALDIGAAGRLNITGSGARLRVRGPARTQNTGSQSSDLIAVALSSAGRLSFDGSAAGTPATATYQWTWGNNYWNYRYLSMASNAILDSVSGSGFGYFSALNGLPIDASGYSIIRRIGDASNVAFTHTWQDDGNTRFRLQDVWLDQCGGIGSASSIGSSVNWLFERVTFTGTTGSQSLRLAAMADVHALTDVLCDKEVQLDSNNAALTRCAFLGGLVRSGSFDDSVATDCFLNAQVSAPQLAAVSTREYRVLARTLSNGKALQVTASATALTDGIIVEPFGTSSSDGEIFSGTTGEGTHTAPILLPYHDGSADRAIEVFNDLTTIQTIINGTIAARVASIGFGHAGHTTANNGVERARVRHSIFANFDNAVSTASKIGNITTAVVGNYTGAACYNNAGGGVGGAPNLIAGSQGKGYNSTPSSGTPGSGDVDNVDPGFVGAEGGGLARVQTFGRDVLSLGGSISSREDAVLAAINTALLSAGTYEVSAHANHIAGCDIVSLYTWVHDRWAPTNTALLTSVDPASGGWIGAVEGVTSTGELVMRTQPTATPSGFAISPSPVVRMTSDGSTTDTSFTGPVTVALIGSSGVLLGTTTVNAVAGVATFNDLRPCEDGGTLRFSADDVDDLDSIPFSVLTGSGAVILGGTMQRPIKDGETSSARRTISLTVQDAAGAHFNADGETPKLFVNSVLVGDADNPIVGSANGNAHTLSTEEASAYAPGDIIEVVLLASDDHLRASSAWEVFPDDPYAQVASENAIAEAIWDHQIDMFLAGIAFPPGNGIMQIKKSDGTVINLSVTRGPVTGGVLGIT